MLFVISASGLVTACIRESCKNKEGKIRLASMPCRNFYLPRGSVTRAFYAWPTKSLHPLQEAVTCLLNLIASEAACTSFIHVYSKPSFHCGKIERNSAIDEYVNTY